MTFLYKFMQGTCPKSYGMNVANLAGLPTSVVLRARAMADMFEARLELAHKKRDSRGSALDSVAADTLRRVHDAATRLDVDQIRSLHQMAEAFLSH